MKANSMKLLALLATTAVIFSACTERTSKQTNKINPGDTWSTSTQLMVDGAPIEMDLMTYFTSDSTGIFQLAIGEESPLKEGLMVDFTCALSNDAGHIYFKYEYDEGQFLNADCKIAFDKSNNLTIDLSDLDEDGDLSSTLFTLSKTHLYQPTSLVGTTWKFSFDEPADSWGESMTDHYDYTLSFSSANQGKLVLLYTNPDSETDRFNFSFTYSFTSNLMADIVLRDEYDSYTGHLYLTQPDKLIFFDGYYFSYYTPQQ